MPLTNLQAKAAPGAPGIEPRWTSACKSGVGTAISPGNSVWFTLSHGIVNEIYYPYMDQANVRDLELLITDGKDYFCEEKRDMEHETEWLGEGIAAYRIVNTCKQGRCKLTKIVCTDPYHHSFVMHIKLEALEGKLSDYHTYVLLAPHVRNCGYGNDAWVDDMKGYQMLFARRKQTGLALGCSTSFLNRSVGYVGVSDGWSDIHKNKRMTEFHTEAPNGNVALTGELELQGGESTLVLGFGRGRAESSQQVRGTLVEGFPFIIDEYVRGWEKAQEQFAPFGSKEFENMYRTSTAVLLTHRSKSRMGSVIASLSIPWGESKSDNEIGGYHLVWPRDQALTALGFLAAGDFDSAQRVLLYLMANQEADGHWAQNMWDDGNIYWDAVQLDETALPIILACSLDTEINVEKMVQKGIRYLINNGPSTEQDRWEMHSGYNPFTLATTITALLMGAEHFPEEEARFIRETADSWNELIDELLYVTDTRICKKNGVEGYYKMLFPGDERVSIDALALVRYGLRSAHDERILNTIKVIDQTLRYETTTGPGWRRYTDDNYGEYEDGSPYNGSGIGRCWPLLAGERGHVAVAKGDFDEAREMLRTMIAQAGPGGFIPEQVWDAADIPKMRRYNGQPTGAAMPLVWAHSEYIKLLHSIEEERIFDMPTQTEERYLNKKMQAEHTVWTFERPIETLRQGKQLRIQLRSPAKVRWSFDNWDRSSESHTTDSGLGPHYLDLPTQTLEKGSKIVFTFYWCDVEAWEGRDYMLEIR